MNTKFIILLALIVGTFATDDAIATLQKMENSKFGRTILSTIQIQLSASDAVDTLLSLLQNLEASIIEEQHEADTAIQESQKECFDTLTRLQDEINVANTRVQELKEELNELIPLRNRKSKERADRDGFKNMLQDNIVELNKEKQEKDGEWEQVQADHAYAVEVLSQTQAIIQGGLVSFIQIKSPIKPVLVQVSSHLTKSMKSPKFIQKKSIRSIFKVLGQIASSEVHANQGSVQRILDLIEELLERLDNSLDQERRAYEHYCDYFENTMTEWTQMLEETIALIADLDGQITTLNKQIAYDQSEKAEQSARSASKSTEKKDKEQTCDDESEQYSQSRAERDDQKSVVSDAIGLINSKLRILKQYIANRK